MLILAQQPRAAISLVGNPLWARNDAKLFYSFFLVFGLPYGALAINGRIYPIPNFSTLSRFREQKALLAISWNVI